MCFRFLRYHQCYRESWIFVRFDLGDSYCCPNRRETVPSFEAQLELRHPSYHSVETCPGTLSGILWIPFACSPMRRTLLNETVTYASRADLARGPDLTRQCPSFGLIVSFLTWERFNRAQYQMTGSGTSSALSLYPVATSRFPMLLDCRHCVSSVEGTRLRERQLVNNPRVSLSISLSNVAQSSTQNCNLVSDGVWLVASSRYGTVPVRTFFLLGNFLRTALAFDPSTFAPKTVVC